MDPVVPQEIVTELTQILSNLVLGDNDIRASAEQAVNDRLEHSPELYLLALAQFAIAADTEVMRSFSLVLLRRLLLRPAQHHQQHKTVALILYDRLSSHALSTLERLLLHSLAHEPAQVVRHKSVDTICDLANGSMSRGRPWHALQAQTFNMIQSPEAGLRESAYRVFEGCPNLVMDLQTDAVLGVLQKGLQDAQSIQVRHAALRSSVSYLTACDASQRAQSSGLVYAMLSTLPSLQSSPAILASFLSTLTPLCTSSPKLFAPHLSALLAFLPALILPSVDCGPTPTVAKPFPTPHGAFTFPPSPASPPLRKGSVEDTAFTEKEDVRKAALEFMVSLSEARPSMVRKVSGWVAAIVRGCLEGMGEFDDDPQSLQLWLDADPADDPTDESYPHVFEQSLDRLACALGGKQVLPPAFQYIPSMLASYDWRVRHAGLMAIAAIGEGTSKVMQNELGKVVDLVTPMFNDVHPRVRYAACQCVGQLCTDLEEVIQERYHAKLFAVLIPALESPEPRVHSHAAAALINFCEGVERDTLVPYLDSIVERLLKLLNPSGEAAAKTVRRYVQEQAVTTLAMVADASETTFGKHYSSIMPLLLNVLRNAEGPGYRKLRVKAMECAGLIAIAVGQDVFRADAHTLVELLMRIQNGPVDPDDTLLNHYLIATWAKVCQAMGPDFEPYLAVVMPPLLAAASAKPDLSVYDDDQQKAEERDGWETIQMDGKTVGIKTSAIEEKCQAFETLVIYCSTLGPRFVPYLSQSLELALPCLRFYYHDGVREACAMLIPMLLSCGKSGGALTHAMVAATFQQLITVITSESDASFLASLYKCFTDSLIITGGAAALAPEFQRGILEATKRQLQSFAEKRRRRVAQAADELGVGVSGNGIDADAEGDADYDDLMLLEEMEDFALEDMAKMLMCFDTNHALLVAVASVKDLGTGRWDSDDDGDSEG